MHFCQKTFVVVVFFCWLSIYFCASVPMPIPFCQQFLLENIIVQKTYNHMLGDLDFSRKPAQILIWT